MIRCLGVQRLLRPCALVLVSHSSLNLLPLATTCTQVVCPDAGTPCALPWVSRDLVPWCMIFSEVMRAGATFVLGPPHWEVTFSWLMCSGVGVPRTARPAELGVTFPCSPAGAGGLAGPVCWAPGPPLVRLVEKGVRRKDRSVSRSPSRSLTLIAFEAAETCPSQHSRRLRAPKSPYWCRCGRPVTWCLGV